MKESDDKLRLSNLVQVDDAYWGGESHGGKRGRAAKNKTPFVVAVSLDENGCQHFITVTGGGHKSENLEMFI